MPPIGWNIGAAAHALARRNGPHPVAESRLQQRAQLVGIARAAIFKSLVAPVFRIEVALRHEEAHQSRLILGGHREIQSVLIDSLHQQLVHLADDVGFDLPHAYSLFRERACVGAFVIEVGTVRFVDENLQRRHPIPCSSSARRYACTECATAPALTHSPSSHLHCWRSPPISVCVVPPRMVQHEPAHPVSRLEYVEIVAEPGKLISECQSRDACAEYEHLRITRLAGKRRTFAGVRGHQIPRRERGHHQR